jgi:hypothetical protein
MQRSESNKTMNEIVILSEKTLPETIPLQPIGQEQEQEQELPKVIIHHKNHFVGLRGIASIIVMVHHWSSRTWIGTGPSSWLQHQVPFNMFFNSSLGLYIFFIVTGRLIALRFLKTAEKVQLEFM